MNQFKVKKIKIESELNQHYSTYQDLLTELSRLNNEVEDTSLTTEKRAKSKEAFSEKLKEARTMEKDINEFQQQRTMQLNQDEMRLMKEFTEEIMSLVRDKCKSAGYDFVFDKSGIGVSSFPILIYYKDARDFTDEVIAELNKRAQSGEIGKQ